MIIDIDKSKREKLDEIMNCERLFIEGDAADDDILIKAGISRAKCLLTAMNDDAQNTFAVLSARGLNSKIKIVARCVSPNSRAKLLRAGADKIILPNFIGAKRMAAIALRPEAADFVDTLLYDDHNAGIRIETVKIPAQSILIGKSLKDIKLPTRAGVIVVAVKSYATGEFIFNPAHNTIIQENDLLVILGPDKKIKLIFELIDLNDFDKFDKKNLV